METVFCFTSAKPVEAYLISQNLTLIHNTKKNQLARLARKARLQEMLHFPKLFSEPNFLSYWKLHFTAYILFILCWYDQTELVINCTKQNKVKFIFQCKIKHTADRALIKICCTRTIYVAEINYKPLLMIWTWDLWHESPVFSWKVNHTSKSRRNAKSL